MSTATATKITAPVGGAKMTIANGRLIVPDNPIIPFIEGDGTGPDIWRASVRVMDAAVQKAYGGQPQDPLDGSLCGREVEQAPAYLAAR